MYEMLNNLDGLLAALLLLVSVAAAVAMRRRPRVSLILLGIGAALTVTRLVGFAAMWSIDWRLVDGRVLVEAPLGAVPLAAVAVLSGPRLRERAASAYPAALRVMVPLWALAVASFVGVYAAFVSRPVAPYVDDAAWHWLPVLLAGALLTLWASYRRDRGTLRSSVRAMIGVVAAVLVAGSLAASAYSSKLPDRMAMADHAGHPGAGVSVADPRGPIDPPDRRFTLTAAQTAIRLTSGRLVEDAWTFNGKAPGPELRVTEGDLVEVTLRNQLPRTGVTVHWHGLDVPNAEDGVAGVTQNAVPPGGTHIYRFRAEQVGTFWYHTHQDPLWAIRRGLFGALVVTPRAPSGETDIVAMPHEWRIGDERVASWGTDDLRVRRQIPAGTRVRIRLINTDNNPADDASPRGFVLLGVRYRVAAIDGVEVNQPTELGPVELALATGGRYDLVFTMPDGPVRLADRAGDQLGMELRPAGSDPPPPLASELETFDPLSYGGPTATPFGPGTRYDEQFTQLIDDRVGFYDRSFRLMPTINGKSFPDVPTLVVGEGDLVKVLIVNRSHQNHPMHLHGHHALVLSRSGRPATGSPWWTDSLDLRPGDTYEIAFRADNPGIWMDHCHNVDHAANGMVMHLAYEGVYSPFSSGRATGNHPE